MTSLPKILVFASGSKEGGGSGFENLVKATKDGRLRAEIVGVVSNEPEGGVSKRAKRLVVPFTHFPAPYTAEQYQRIARESGAQFFSLSGWLKLVRGLDPNTAFNSKTVINIHPGPLPDFGGKGMFGHHVHQAVIAAHKAGPLSHTAVNMHYVTEKYDEGPVFHCLNILIKDGETAEALGKRVNLAEHIYQPLITDLVVHDYISWDGVNPDSLTLPPGYEIQQEYREDAESAM